MEQQTENKTEKKRSQWFNKIEQSMPFLNVGNALKVTCVGFAVGVVLRVVQMLYCFDYDTGFYTDGGVLAGCSLAVAVLASLLGGVMCFFSRRYFGPYVPRKNNVLGVVAVLSGAALLASAVLQAVDYAGYLKTGMSAYDSAQRGVIHVAFMASCFLFGVVQLFVSIGFFQGKNNLAKAPLLYLVGVLWGIAYLILVYVFYAKSSSFVENFFAIFGAASTLLSLFYLCKLFAGVEEESAAKRVFVAGIFAVVFTVIYSFSNLVLLLLGKSYVGEIPSLIQLSSLGVSLFLLVFLMTFRRYSIRRAPKEAEDAPAAQRKTRRFRPD